MSHHPITTSRASLCCKLGNCDFVSCGGGGACQEVNTLRRNRFPPWPYGNISGLSVLANLLCGFNFLRVQRSAATRIPAPTLRSGMLPWLREPSLAPVVRNRQVYTDEWVAIKRCTAFDRGGPSDVVGVNHDTIKSSYALPSSRIRDKATYNYR